jgi:hypothetical protein
LNWTWRQILTALATALPAAFTFYNIWATNLRPREFILVAPSVLYAVNLGHETEPELIESALVIQNVGARSGVAIGINMRITNQAGQSRDFFAAEVGRFTRERSASGLNERYKPLVIQGRDSKVENFVFAPMDARSANVIGNPGIYKVKIDLYEPPDIGLEFFDRWLKKATAPVEFEVTLEARLIPDVPIPLRAIVRTH